MRFSSWVATGAGVGMIPFAPGTFGTILAIPLYCGLMWGLNTLCGQSSLRLLLYLIAVGALFLIGCRTADAAEKHFSRKDPGNVVIDEIVGFLIAMTALPMSPIWILAGFVGFRVFDIFKIWPANVFEQRFSGGLGIMIDDVVSGIQVALILNIFTIFL